MFTLCLTPQVAVGMALVTAGSGGLESLFCSVVVDILKAGRQGFFFNKRKIFFFFNVLPEPMCKCLFVGGVTVDPGNHFAYTYFSENTGGGPWVWETSGSEMDVLAVGGSPPTRPCITRIGRYS